MSLVAAIQRTGVAHFELIAHSASHRGACASDIKKFLYNLSPCIPRDSCIILDNATLHHSVELEACWTTIANAYGISHKFLPPYSPFLNPIELLFSVLKSKLRKQVFTNAEQLVDAVTLFMKDNITSSLCTTWFEHSYKFTVPCLACVPYEGILVPIPES